MMKFKFSIECDPEVDPDMVGEFLRNEFFDQKYVISAFGTTYQQKGRYNTFAVRNNVTELPEELVDPMWGKMMVGMILP